MNKSSIAYRIDSLLKREPLNETDIREMLESEISSSDMDAHIRNRLSGICDLWSDEAFSRIEDELNLVFRMGVKPTEKWLRSCLISMREKPLVTSVSVPKHSGDDIKKTRATRLALLMLEHMQGVDFSAGEKELPILMAGLLTNNVDVVRRLIEMRCDVNEHSSVHDSSIASSDKTPLIVAAVQGNKECLELLINAGADTNCLVESKLQLYYRVPVTTNSTVAHTPLSVAALLGYNEIVELLLAAAPSEQALSVALACAIFGGHDSLIRRLMEAGATFNFDSTNQLHVDCLNGTVAQGCIVGLECLCSLGLSSMLKKDDRLIKNAFFYAARGGAVHMIAKFCDCGYELTKQDMLDTCAWLSHECFCYMRDRVPKLSEEELTELLKEYVSNSGSGDCLKEILSMGADPNQSCNEEESILSKACDSYSSLDEEKKRMVLLAAVQHQTANASDIESKIYLLLTDDTLEEFRQLYSAYGNKFELRSMYEDSNDYKVMELVHSKQLKTIRFLMSEGVELSSGYMIREAIDMCDDECLKLAIEARGETPVSVKLLCEAINKGFNEGVKMMLAHGVDTLDVRDIVDNPLCRAITSKNVGCMEMLLKTGADVNAIDNLNDKDLIVALAAVGVDDVATLTRLMEAGLQIHEDNDSLLMTAASSGAVDCLKLLLPLIKTSRTELLCKGAPLGRPDIISLLLEEGADVKTKREVVSGPFHTEKRPPLLACITGNESINKDKESESVELLLKAGGQVNDRVENPYHNEDKYRCCLGEAIVRYCSADCIVLLLAAGAEVNTPTNKLEETPLMLAAASGQARVVDLLLAAGSNVNTISAKGATALMLAAASGFPQIVRRLIEAGADMHVKDYAEKDAFMYALQNGNLRSVEELLIAGCKPSVLSSIPAPFFPMVDNVLEILRRNNVAEEDIARLLGSMLPAVVSESKPDVEIITKLINYGADVNAVDENGNTGLLTALLKKCSGPIIKVIMAAGANPRVTNGKGQTCIEIANKSGCASSVITMLEKAIAKIEKAEAKAVEKAAKAKEKEAKAAKKKK